MLSLAEAKAIADSVRTYGPSDICTEYADAYVFSGSNDPETEGGFGTTIAVMKTNGRVYGFTNYLRMHDWDPGEYVKYSV